MKQSIVVHLSFKEFRLLCINSIAAGDQAINFVITDYSALLEMQFDGLIVVYITTSAAGFKNYERSKLDFIDAELALLSKPASVSGKNVVQMNFKNFRFHCLEIIATRTTTQDDQAIILERTDYSALLEMEIDGLIVVYITTSAAGFNHYERTEFDFIDTKFRRLSQPCRDSGFWRDNCQLM